MGICASKEEPQAKPADKPQDAKAAAPTPAAAAPAAGAPAEDEFEQKACEAIRAQVFMISGCCDNQTSADVGNTDSFDLPDDVGVSGAGGACTNALLHQAGEGELRATFAQMMRDANEYLKDKGYTQRPCLSTSRRCGMGEEFSMVGDSTGKRRAVHIGINYVGHERGRLNGCVNDAVAWNRYLNRLDFANEDIHMLVDEDPQAEAMPEGFASMEKPTKANIMAAIEWLASSTQEGDVAVLTYSGHGAQITDKTGNEEDGKDEVLCPCDYPTARFIVDDTLLEKLVVPLPSGARLVCIMDCCHSGSILDLPYTFLADDEGLRCLEQNPECGMRANMSGFGGKMRKFCKRIPGFDHLTSLF